MAKATKVAAGIYGSTKIKLGNPRATVTKKPLKPLPAWNDGFNRSSASSVPVSKPKPGLAAHRANVRTGSNNPAERANIVRHEEIPKEPPKKKKYGEVEMRDDDDEDDDEDDENPLVFRATAAVALGAWFAYTRKKRADEERRLGKTTADAETAKSKLASNPVSKFVDTVRADVTSITAKSDDGKTPKQRYRERRAAERAAAEARRSR